VASGPALAAEPSPANAPAPAVKPASPSAEEQLIKLITDEVMRQIASRA
jgi:hypothetical protein